MFSLKFWKDVFFKDYVHCPNYIPLIKISKLNIFMLCYLIKLINPTKCSGRFLFNGGLKYFTTIHFNMLGMVMFRQLMNDLIIVSF
jgi:hypothetical protein